MIKLRECKQKDSFHKKAKNLKKKQYKSWYTSQLSQIEPILLLKYCISHYKFG